MVDFEAKIKDFLKREGFDIELEVPPDERFGDYAMPCFEQAKKQKKSPNVVAKEVKDTLAKKKPEFIEKIEVNGPYVNFFLNHKSISEAVLKEIFDKKDDFGMAAKKKDTILIDYSAPNIAKPFGIGHLRSTVIGNSLYKTFNFLGYRVIGVNHLGDYGKQFGMLISAYKKWGDEKRLEKEGVKYLLELYVKYNEAMEKDEKLDEEAKRWFKKLEDGDKDALALYGDFREISMEEFNRIYQMLDVDFDSYHGEAFYADKIDDVLKLLEKKKLSEMNEGSLVVNLEKYGMPPLMLIKSDGATTYALRDLATALFRIKEYNPSKIIYVVGSEQKLHFQQLFKALEMLGHKDMLYHVDFGLYRFPEGKMSTRKGNIIFMEEVLDKSIELALKIINEKNPLLENKENVARHVGIGAIVFGDLYNDRIKDIVFDWDKILDFEGETAPYVQYTYARASSIIRKACDEHELHPGSKVNYESFNIAEELRVIKMLGKFESVVINAANNYKPHLIAHYLIELSQNFNEFYHKCPVLSEMEHISKARLLLVDCARQVLKNGLHLLGVKAVERM